MTFQQLTYVVKVSQYGSINKAAQKMFLSQSSISSAIQDLEKELGIKFFNRSNRGVDFTPEGREFLGYANSLLEQKQHIEEIYNSNNLSAPAAFNVSSQRYPFAEDAFIRLVRHMDNPKYTISLKEKGMDSVIEDVYDHYSDLGVIFLSTLTEQIIRKILRTKSIEFHEILSIKPSAFMRYGHPLMNKKNLTVEDVADYPYLTFDHNPNVAIDFSEEINFTSFTKPARTIHVSDRAAAVSIITHTDTVTTGSGLLVENLSDSGIITVPLSDISDIKLGWICSKNKKLSEIAFKFIEFLEVAINEAYEHTEQLRSSLLGDEEA